MFTQQGTHFVYAKPVNVCARDNAKAETRPPGSLRRPRQRRPCDCPRTSSPQPADHGRTTRKHHHRRGLLASDLHGHHHLLTGATAEFAALHGHLRHPGLRSTRRDRRKSSGPRPTSYLSPWRRRPHVRHTKNHDGRRKQPRSANHLRRQRRIWRNLQQRNRTRHRAHHCEPLPTRLGKVSGGLRRARIFRKTLTPFKTPSRRHCASTGPR